MNGAEIDLSWARRPLRALGDALGSAGYKSCADDFEVTESLGFEPSGRGEHLYFFVEKRDANSHEVAVELAEACHVNRRSVGYAGRKDKFALTRQWFSVHRPGIDRPRLVERHHWRVLQVTRHAKQLRRGVLAGNHFNVLLRDVVADPAAIRARYDQIVTHGVPNYFGSQRFGANNLERAQAGIDDEMALSAARAALFNRMLSQRVGAGTWLQPVVGEPCLRPRSNGWLMDADRDHIEAGLADPCLPLFGPTPGLEADRQAAWIAEFSRAGSDVIRLLQAHSWTPFRRRSRLRPLDPSLEITPEGIRIRATLGPGAFMTALLDALFDLEDRHATHFDQ
ncbi:tRNA pseudouridine(13) synthase TruD [Litorivicinus lipolyticus]|uniref:tRNA pseudouridine(13) synthase TruD n=1 Tax=Litorivicinus lipolyticus TaxID=418701 RepID=UPI003B59DE8B